MGVNFTRSGGIYIEISGDYSQLKKDLDQVRAIAKANGAEISNSLSAALSPTQATNLATNITKSLAGAQNAARAFGADLSTVEKNARAIGQQMNLSAKALEDFTRMQTKAFQTQTTKAFTNNLREIQNLTGSSDKEMNALAKSLGGVGNEFDKAARSSRNLCLNYASLYLEAIKLTALKTVWDGLKESFALASRYETLGVVVQQVGKTAGYSAVEVDKNVNAIRRMGISGIEARQSLTQLIAAQVDISKSAQLARIAQDAAVIGGIDSSEAFERMSSGIATANTKMLRTIGIIVDFEQAYRKYAAGVGKSADDLTEQEKVQARVNAVMEAGKGIVGSYEAAMGTLGKQMSSLSRIQKDFATDTGNFLLDFAKASGIFNAYGSALEAMSKKAVAARASQLGLSDSVIQQAFDAGGLSGGRELAENFAAAKQELDGLEAAIAAAAARGKNVSFITEDFKLLKDEIFGSQSKLQGLEEQLAVLDKEGVTSGRAEIVAQINAIKQSVLDAAKAFPALREQIAALFSFSLPKTSWEEDLANNAQKTALKIKEASDKTATAIKNAKEKTLKAYIDSARSPEIKAALGKDADAIIQNLQDEYNKSTKGARNEALGIERTSYQAAEAARAAQDSLKNLQLRHSELVAQLDGNSLGVALAKNLRDYETQMDDIRKKEEEIEKNRNLWTKGGKISAEAKASLDEQQKYLEQEKEILKANKEANDALARRKELISQQNTEREYAGLLGNVKAVYAAEVNLLNIDYDRIAASREKTLADIAQEETLERRNDLELALKGILDEQLLIQEKIRIAAARANFDVSGMLETGFNNMARDAQQKIVDFWEKTLPQSIGTATDSIGNAFAEIGFGTKSTAQAFDDMGKAIQRTFQQILSDFINMSLRMALFGNSGKGGGGLGGILGGIVGLFTGGGGSALPNPAAGTWGVSAADILMHAKGGVLAAPALSAYSGSIVSKPTVFPFAKGIGLMGEAGAEAIMPLRRNAQGRLGVETTGGNQQQAATPQVNVNIHTPPGTRSETRQSQGPMGDLNLEVLFEMIDSHQASGFTSRRSKSANALIKMGVL